MGEIWTTIQEILAGMIALVYQVIPSLGISIIVVTIVINILVFPLTLKQTRSSRAMQEIQPEIKRLQKKYKDDPETLQKEMLGLYKEKGVNPAGCLFPMLIQLPIWFALFSVLRVDTSTEPPTPNLQKLVSPETDLYQDLVAGDTGFLSLDLFLSASQILSLEGLVSALPYFLLIAIVIVTQYVQQRMLTPSTGTDDKQVRQMQGIMRIMPLFFGFISYSLPAGLVLSTDGVLSGTPSYFATSNIFRIGQQQLILKMDGRPGSAKEAEEEKEPNPKPKKQQGSAKKRNRRRRT